MANAFSNRIGVTVEEGITNAVSLNSGISTRNIGMLVERVRGVAGKPILVNSLKEDKKIFGQHNVNMYSSYVVENLFKNSGGYPVNLYQSRVVGAGSLPAEVMVVQNNAGATNATTQTVQNAGANQPQIQHIDATLVAIGESVKVVVSDAGGSFSETFTRLAGASGLDDMIEEIAVWLGTVSLNTSLTMDYTAGMVITVTGDDNAPFTVVVSNPTISTVDIFKVFAGMEGAKDVGTWGNDLRVRVYPVGNVNGSNDGYLAQVFYQGYLVESFTSIGASFENLAEQINQRSGYVVVELVAPETTLTVTFDSLLSGGVYNSPVETDFEPKYHPVTEEPLGMAVFETIDVQLLACPEVFSTNYARLCEDFARTTMKFFIFNMPYLATESVVQQYYNTLATPDQSFAGGYLEWVEVPADGDGNKIWIPQIGYILGAGYIRKAGLNNGDVWTPPAGVETNAKAIYRFTHTDLNDDKQSRYVKKWRCNVTKYVKNVGFCSWSSRTYSNNSLFESIHVRLETNWLIKSIDARNQKFIQRIISPSMKKSIEAENLVWFKNLYERGGIEQSIPFADAVIIEITVSKEDRKEAEMDIAWIPPECLEHIHIRVNRNDGILITNF